MTRALAWTAAQIRSEITRLERIRDAGPQPVPPTTDGFWHDPQWLDAWLSTRPDMLTQQIEALTTQLARMNERRSHK